MKCELQEVTPELATQWLEQNKINRNVRPTKVQEYAADIAEGRWTINGDTIKFSKGGRLIDGQHRLIACVLAQKPFKSFVVAGLSDKAVQTIDGNAVRSTADVLKLTGTTNDDDVTAFGHIARLVDSFLSCTCIAEQACAGACRCS